MFLPTLSRKVFPEWNSKIILVDRLFEFCHSVKVDVVWADDHEEPFGCYTPFADREFIVLNKNLDPQMCHWVFLHECYHKIAHHPETSRFSPSMESKNDAEANTFAAIALMPKPLILSQTVDDICYYYGIPRKLVEIRKNIADQYDI